MAIECILAGTRWLFVEHSGWLFHPTGLILDEIINYFADINWLLSHHIYWTFNLKVKNILGVTRYIKAHICYQVSSHKF
jgi:hypothetical protein